MATPRKKATVDKKQSIEDKILGKPIEKVKKVATTYEDESIIYKVTNLQISNEPVLITGELVETFIGCKNKAARRALKEGAKEVITKDMNGQETYKIEVVE